MNNPPASYFATSSGDVKMPYDNAMRVLSHAITEIFLNFNPPNDSDFNEKRSQVEKMAKDFLLKHLDIDESFIETVEQLCSRKELEAIKRWKAGEKLTWSTGIHDDSTAGYGELDSNGFWEYPLPLWLVDKIEDIRYKGMKNALERPDLAKMFTSKKENNDEQDDEK